MQGPSDEIFLDMFEDEYNNEKVSDVLVSSSFGYCVKYHPSPSPVPHSIQSFNVNVPFLMMDASMLLPPTDTPLTGIEFTRRLPCGETERARKVNFNPKC